MSAFGHRGRSPEPHVRLLAMLGALGLVPFAGPLVLVPEARWGGLDGSAALAIYGAAILSFLGGVRMAAATFASQPRPREILISMAPPLAGYGFAALVVAGSETKILAAGGLLGLALAFAAQGFWDITARALPSWYRGQRRVLTLGAGLGILIGAWRAGI